MASVSDFLVHVLPSAPGCSFPLAEQHIRDVCIDFCTHVPIVTQNCDPAGMVAGVLEYDVDVPMGQEAARILEAAYLGRPLRILGPGDSNFGANEELPGEPTAVKLLARNAMELDRPAALTVPRALTLRVSTKPSRNATTVADVLLDSYGYEIGQGVLGRLLKMPGHKFSKPAASYAYEATYINARSTARASCEPGVSNSAPRARYRPFG